MKPQPDTTYELTVVFSTQPAAAAATLKSAVVAWLDASGIRDYVEGVIDGVDLLVETEDPEAAFAGGDGDTTPLSFFDFAEAPLWTLGRALEAVFPQGLRLAVQALETRSWSEAWDQDFHSVETARFLVGPADDGAAAAPGKLRLLLTRGAAFGQGDHATTQACLEALEALAPAAPRRGCLDVGTGTGILAIAASRLGFAPLVGTDIDDEVLAEARVNAALNGVDLTLHNLSAPPQDGERYDLVVANILVPVLHHLMPRLARALSAAGRLLLAGFIEKDAASLLATCERSGLTLEARHAVRGWLCLTLRHQATAP